MIASVARQDFCGGLSGVEGMKGEMGSLAGNVSPRASSSRPSSWCFRIADGICEARSCAIVFDAGRAAGAVFAKARRMRRRSDDSQEARIVHRPRGATRVLPRAGEWPTKPKAKNAICRRGRPELHARCPPPPRGQEGSRFPGAGGSTLPSCSPADRAGSSRFLQEPAMLCRHQKAKQRTCRASFRSPGAGIRRRRRPCRAAHESRHPRRRRRPAADWWP